MTFFKTGWEAVMQFWNVWLDSGLLTGSWERDLVFLLGIILTFVLVSCLLKVRVCICSVLFPGLLLMAISLIVGQVYLKHKPHLIFVAFWLTALVLVVPLTRMVLKISLFRSFVMWAVTLGVAIGMFILLVRVYPAPEVHSKGQLMLDKSAAAIREMLKPKEK